MAVKGRSIVIDISDMQHKGSFSSQWRCARICGCNSQVIGIPLLPIQPPSHTYQVDDTVLGAKGKVTLSPLQGHIDVGKVTIIWVRHRDSSNKLTRWGSL
jgi:hypothetical protein